MAMSFDQTTNSDGLEEKLVGVNRNAKVETGGRRFTFTAFVVVGDKKGRIGYGLGKAREVSVAIQKASGNARKNLLRIELNNATLQHTIITRHGASKVFMKPASKGTGIIAGHAIRAVCEVLGIDDILTKIYGSTNPNNVILAVLNGLKNMASPESIAEKRGKTVAEILGKQKPIAAEVA